ncbi:MAG: hypothetical protein WD342_03600 [Verrucomicrobiales bacterium]
MDRFLALWDRVDALEAKLAELERNSRTSSKPPSTSAPISSSPTTGSRKSSPTFSLLR